MHLLLIALLEPKNGNQKEIKRETKRKTKRKPYGTPGICWVPYFKTNLIEVLQYRPEAGVFALGQLRHVLLRPWYWRHSLLAKKFVAMAKGYSQFQVLQDCEVPCLNFPPFDQVPLSCFGLGSCSFFGGSVIFGDTPP